MDSLQHARAEHDAPEDDQAIAGAGRIAKQSIKLQRTRVAGTSSGKARVELAEKAVRELSACVDAVAVVSRDARCIHDEGSTPSADEGGDLVSFQDD